MRLAGLTLYFVVVVGTAVSVLLANLLLDFLGPPVRIDEIWSGHGAWLSVAGTEGVDAYPGYFPTYIWLLARFVAPDSLGWFLTLRWLAAACYAVSLGLFVAIACRYLRAARGDSAIRAGWMLSLLAIALVAIGLQRGLEIRPESLTLPLVLTGWLCLLPILAPTPDSRSSGASKCLLMLAMSAGLFGIAGAFSLRTGFLAAGLGLATAVALWPRGRSLAAAGLVLYGLVGAATVVLMISLTSGLAEAVAYLELNTAVKQGSGLWHKLTKETTSQFLRPALLALSVGLVVAATVAGRRGRDGRSGILVGLAIPLAVAWAGVLVDPEPFAYAFIYPALPAVALLAVFLGVAGGSWTVPSRLAVVILCVAGIVPNYLNRDLHHNIVDPDSGRILARLHPEALPDLAGQSIEGLVGLLHRLQFAPWGDATLSQTVAVREELCRRLAGERILSGMALHPVCVRDATYFWALEWWRSLLAGGGSALEFSGLEDVEARRPGIILPLGPGNPSAFPIEDHLDAGFLAQRYVPFAQGYIRRDLANGGSAVGPNDGE